MEQKILLCIEFHECLRFTSGGKFILETEGKDITITHRRAKNWLKKRRPRLSWNRMFKQTNEWLESEKTENN